MVLSRCAHALLLSGIVSACMPAIAQEASVPELAQRLRLDIPAQPLASALQAYAHMTGQSVFFDSELAAGCHSASVHGEFAPPEALRRLLAGTHLTARHTSANAFSLMEAASGSVAEEDASSPPQEPMPVAAARVVQSALERALCGSPHARPGTYRALVQLWVGSAGQVQRVQLLRSTGQARRDSAIEAAMKTLVLSAPGEPGQPLTILLLPKTSGAADVCAAAATAAP